MYGRRVLIPTLTVVLAIAAVPLLAQRGNSTTQKPPQRAPQEQQDVQALVTAVDAALMSDEEVAQQVAAQNPIRTVNDKTFIQQNGVWTDTTFNPDTMETQKVVFLSDEYFALITSNPTLGDYFALGERVIVVVDGVAYEVVTE